MGTLRFFEEVVSFKIRRTFGFADYILFVIRFPVICLFDNSVKTKRRERSRGTFYYQRPGLFQAALDIVGVILDYGRVVFLFEQRGGDQEVGC